MGGEGRMWREERGEWRDKRVEGGEGGEGLIE